MAELSFHRLIIPVRPPYVNIIYNILKGGPREGRPHIVYRFQKTATCSEAVDCQDEITPPRLLFKNETRPTYP